MSDTIWLQVTSGRGPAECQLAVAKLVPIICEAALKQAFVADVIDTVPGSEKRTLVSALLSIRGGDPAGFAASWQGTIKWIAPSPFRPSHKRKNWFVGVDILAAPEQGCSRLDPRDVAFEAMRAGGAGGQHVNKTESAVRATHRPTGIVAVAREERSQHQNKRLALARIAAALKSGIDARSASADRDRWGLHDELERGDAVRVFRGEAFEPERR